MAMIEAPVAASAPVAVPADLNAEVIAAFALQGVDLGATQADLKPADEALNSAWKAAQADPTPSKAILFAGAWSDRTHVCKLNMDKILSAMPTVLRNATPGSLLHARARAIEATLREAAIRVEAEEKDASATLSEAFQTVLCPEKEKAVMKMLADWHARQVAREQPARLAAVEEAEDEEE